MAFDEEILLIADTVQFLVGETVMEIYDAVTAVAGQVVVVLIGVEDPSAADPIEPGPVREVDAVQGPFLHELAHRPEDGGPAYGRVGFAKSLPELVGGETLEGARHAGEFFDQQPSWGGIPLP